jgi:DNA mismatch repair protein MutS
MPLLRPPVREGAGTAMQIDAATRRNLELTETLFEKRVQGSLLGVLDRTETAMGARKLKQWIREPLNEIDAIMERLNAVELLVNDVLIRNNLREALKPIYDLERLIGRIASGNANGRDLIALKQSIYGIPEIKAELSGCDDSYLRKLEKEMGDLGDVFGLIDVAIVEDPPYTIKEGNLICSGYSEELDLLKDSIRDGQAWIASLEDYERKRTGIKNLKVGFNKVFGYYLEITKSNYDSVPDDYIRKQTLVNC